MSPATIAKIGKYEVTAVIGRGGMGVVYKAMDRRMNRLVAIKMVTGAFAENEEQLKRFYREARSTGMLQHPGIVIVHDLGDEEGNPYLVMEYLEGAPLNKLMDRGVEFTTTEKLDLIMHVCNALHYAHGRGVVHRDIKPANIMVLRDGSVKIVDFGIALIADHSLTRTGQVMGTIHYMSPEQIKGQTVDGRTDIFAAGVMLYKFLTGHLPFEGIDTVSTMRIILDEPPPSLRQYLQGVPEELERVLQRALAKDREARYPSAQDFAADLLRLRQHVSRLPSMQPIFGTSDRTMGGNSAPAGTKVPLAASSGDTKFVARSYEPTRAKNRTLPPASISWLAPIRGSAQKARRRRIFAATGFVSIAILAVLSVLGGKLPGRGATAKLTTYVQVNAVPWGTITSINSTDSKFLLNLNQETPLRVPLAPGEYTVNLKGPSGEQRIKQIRVSDDSPGSYTEVFQVIDVEQLLNSH